MTKFITVNGKNTDEIRPVIEYAFHSTTDTFDTPHMSPFLLQYRTPHTTYTIHPEHILSPYTLYYTSPPTLPPPTYL